MSYSRTARLTCFRTLPEDSKPILMPESLKIGRKPRVTGELLPNGFTDAKTAHTNGTGTKRKRDADEAGLDEDLISKRGKVHELPPKKDDPVVLNDTGNGAIVIDDD